LTGPQTAPPLDERDAPAFAAALRALAAGYVPQWRPGQQGADVAMLQIVAHQLQAIARRLNQAPDKNKLAFLDLAGVSLVTAQPARAPVVFELADNATDLRLPAGTRLAAPPPPGGTSQISYETEASVGLAVAKLREVVSLWPGRDQYIDHSAAATAGQPFQLFHQADLVNTPHVLYLAHNRLLALSGASAVTASFELTTPSSEYLDIRWEYWDGAVWRPFADMRPACSNAAAAQLDSTNGLRSSGAYQLRTDCATTAPATVDGISAYWVRARLEETQPPDPARVLPEVESIRLSTTISRSYATIWRVAVAPDPSAQLNRAGSGIRPVDTLSVQVLDATGVPLENVDVGNWDTGATDSTDDQGRVAELPIVAGEPNTIDVMLDTFDQTYELTPDADTPLQLTFTLDMLSFDQAASGSAAVNLSQPFPPLGLQPQPGAALYFSHAEAFGKPGAQLRIYVQPAKTADQELGTGTATGEKRLDHVVSWEYWNGRSWVSLYTTGPKDNPQPADFGKRGFIELSVPADLSPTTVADTEALWMRARLVSGGFGFTKTVPIAGASGSASGPAIDVGAPIEPGGAAAEPGGAVVESGGAAGPGSGATSGGDTGAFTFFVAQPPVLGDFRLGYTWQDGPHPPERVLTYNDFRFADHTEEAVWPGRTFQPFSPVSDSTPALYLGFDRKLPVDDLGVFLDVAEQHDDTEGPGLAWEFWDGFSWQRVLVGDETRHLRVPGIVSFIGPEDSQPLARFGTERHWLRARLIEDGPPGEPTLNAIYPNAVWAVQRQTFSDEPLGAATGQPSLVLAFRQLPVLPGQEIEVRELQGARADVEWRILAAELFGTGRALQDLETQLGADSAATDISYGALRLVRDRAKRVTEAWVLWQERAELFGSGPADRHYAVDRARGRVFFGNGVHGRIPPAGAAVSARRYQTGGGAAGNVAARTISQLLAPVGGIETVFNAVAAEGGADGETLTALLTRGPATVRHRGRAVTADDYAALAREASPSVAAAQALGGRDPSGLPVPGWVTLVIIPQSAEPRPYPSFGLREDVRRFIAERAPADVAAAGQIEVTGPDYVPIDVSATVVPRDPTEAGAVEQAVRQAIAGFLHPLHGGPAGRGWQPGQGVWLSDLAPLLERAGGVDHVTDVELRRGGQIQGDHVPVAGQQIPVAGDIQLRLVGG
jgi:uncharacterized phage protein gp47/JayE